MSEMIQVPDGWEVKQSSELCSGIADGTHDTPQPSFFGFKLVTSKNLKDNKLDFEDCYLISEEDYNAINKRSQVNQFDILFGMIGTIGNPVIILDKKIDFAIKNVGLFRFNGDYELAKWFYYYLSSEQFKNYLDFILSGSSQKFVSLGMLRTLPILIPKEKKEQEKIAKILLTLDKAIESTNRLIEKEKNIKTALMQELLTNGIDKDGHICTRATHTYKESELGLIPDDWEVKKVSQLSKTFAGGTPDRENSSYYNGNIPWVKSGEVNQSVITKTEETITQNGLNNSSAKFVQKGTILVAMYGATAGKVALLNIEATTNQAVLAVPLKNDDTFFVIYMLELHMSKLVFQAQGSGQPNLSKQMVDNMLLPLPSIDEQKQIAKILTTQDKKIETEETNLAKLKELKKGLMNDLLSGKVRAGL